YQQEIVWKEKGLRFGIINIEAVGDRFTRMKIWFNDESDSPSIFWVESGQKARVNRGETSYLLSAKQRYATGLQVAKDPGVWIVYLGCAIMLIGLYMAFFLSHRRIWLNVDGTTPKTVIYFTGSANKNKIGFDKLFKELEEKIQLTLE
ncbi:MAG: cytochrome c biogenesis protein ResB, partial [Bacteroides sp.]|nr:cytochrome c biogenesis protein ResB [Bacteroides sp.]